MNMQTARKGRSHPPPFPMEPNPPDRSGSTSASASASIAARAAASSRIFRNLSKPPDVAPSPPVRSLLLAWRIDYVSGGSLSYMTQASRRLSVLELHTTSPLPSLRPSDLAVTALWPSSEQAAIKALNNTRARHASTPLTPMPSSAPELTERLPTLLSKEDPIEVPATEFFKKPKAEDACDSAAAAASLALTAASAAASDVVAGHQPTNTCACQLFSIRVGV